MHLVLAETLRQEREKITMEVECPSPVLEVEHHRSWREICTAFSKSTKRVCGKTGRFMCAGENQQPCEQEELGLLFQ